jgi:hypothetical protein
MVAFLKGYLHDVSLMRMRAESTRRAEEGVQDNTRGTRDVLTP